MKKYQIIYAERRRDMAEERLPIGQRVLVKELNVSGWIYESATPGQLSSGIERIYGVRLDEVAFPKNFVATEVWHCPLEELELVEGNAVESDIEL